MKKILFALLMLFSLLSFKQAGAQQSKFYYYPTPNVYYDMSNHKYIYLDNGNWVKVTTLPAHVKVNNSRKVVVYNPGPQIWVNNSAHLKKYKDNYPNGKAVGYKGTNPNKANGKAKSNGHN